MHLCSSNGLRRKILLGSLVILLLGPDHEFCSCVDAQNLDNVSSSNLVNQMKAKLSGGDLFGAVPLLNEFKKRVKDGEFKGVNLEKIDYFIGLGYMTGYSASRDKNLLKKATDQFEHYIKIYPNGGDIHYVLLNKVDCHRGTGDFKGAIVTLKALLAQPYISRLRIKERIDSMEKLVQAYYFEQMWDEGIPWFEKFLKITHDKEKKTMAAAALTEAYVAKEKFEKIEALLPHLNTNTKSRYDPRLNYQFLQAGDHLASVKEYQKASLFYSLTMTPKEIVTSYHSLLLDVTPRLNYYKMRQRKFKKNFPKNEEAMLNTLQLEFDTIKRKHDRVGEMLKTPDNDYTRDLRWRKATNYQAMGRDWEAYWGFMGLVTDYPKADKDRRESYMYATFVQAEKIGKRDAAREIADRYLQNPEFEKYAYEVGIRLAAIYKDQAEKSKEKAETAETPPEAEFFRSESNASFDEMWLLCTKLIDQKPKDKLANHVAFMMGSGWIARGEEKFPELVETFNKLIEKDYGDEKPDMLQSLHYWCALAQLYQQEYEQAKNNFDAVVEHFPESDYYEDSLFRRGVCAKGNEDYETARKHLSFFIEKYPKSKMRGEAVVFLGDISAVEEKPDEEISHYKTVVFGTEAGAITEDYKFIDYAIGEAAALMEDKETPKDYKDAIELWKKYITGHPEADHSNANAEIARLLELLDDPTEMFKRYYSSILEYGNNRNGLGVDDILRKYHEKYYDYFGRFNDTYQFLNKLNSESVYRKEVLADRNKLFTALREYPSLDKEVKEKFSFDAAYRQGLISDTAPLQETLNDFKSRLAGLPQVPPEETFTKILKESMADGRDTLKYRLMMFLDNVYKRQGTSLQEKTNLEFPAFFDIPDFQKASPSTLLWMAEYNLKNKSITALKKAKIALVSVVKSFPGTPDGELPALMLLGQLELQNGNATNNAETKKNSYTQAYAFYKRAHDYFPASDQARYAALRQADMLRALGDPTKAILLYLEITKVPQWRGPVHAEATQKIGLCYYETKQIERAFPYFEAVYVRYARYAEWAAQGYLYHAKCLKAKGLVGDAQKVLRVAINDQRIKKTEWFDELNQEL